MAGQAGRLVGRVAIITGAASGIGAASARLFAAEGARLVLADVDAEAVARVARAIEQDGGETVAVRTDVADDGEVAAMVATALERYGRLDVLFANAGVSGTGTVDEIALADLDRVLGVNLRGSFLCARHAVPAMARSGGGSIVFTASELALVGSPGSPAYCATKAGLIGLARAMALDHAPQGIRVNCVCPGATDTPMLRRSMEREPDPAADEADIVRRLPLGRLGRPEEIARAALFLAGDESSFVTGTALVVDGGWTAR
ncbi:MAG TPA: glucose 1-dehydrogenase [Thermomicrobiaceae bacterium]|nr:glucose 1-dehydrogenase [Thermomicrobiaceae bacterium]